MLNVLSTAGASILGVGYIMPLILSALVLEIRKRGGPESLARHRPRMENSFAAAQAQLRSDSRRHTLVLTITKR